MVACEGRLRDAIRWAGFAVSLRPFDERGVRQLLRMLGCGNDRAGVLREYGRFERRMREEFGVDPHPRTREVVEAVMAGEISSGTTPFRD